MSTWALWLAGAAILVATGLLMQRWLRRAARRSLWRFRPRLARYKLARKREIIATLLADPELASDVRDHARAHSLSEDVAWRQVRAYLDEIIPFFNVLAYYKLAYNASRILMNGLYKVGVESVRKDPFAGLPRDSIVIYLMNHRSNADYVLVTYALAGDVSISYAVGEWARAFPLEYLFKSFGSYFIRRRYRDTLYHAVLERYVRLITAKGVTQGIFPEGGLTRDGKLRPAKIGLLDYVLGVARDPALRDRMYIMPVAINYDRVLEDRSLLRELAATDPASARPSRWAQFFEVARYLGANLRRLVTFRWQRNGRAAVVIGEPVPVSTWVSTCERGGISLFELPRHERLRHVQVFCDGIMGRIGELIPVTPVSLACAALQSFESEFVSREALLDRMAAMRDALLELNARVLRADRDIEETFDRAYRMLRMRRVIARTGGGFLILPRGRELIGYYANSIDHLVGPFIRGVRARDALPSAAFR
ncbi:MAG: Glycerol-3-phosphate acyltransferase [Gemmatimonadaceae bacterium]|nr:Glycerol-3-phosphate acyltransferase [Gemmatimonadaceae bacterium]